MRQFYDVSTKLKSLLEEDGNINLVTMGNLDDVDLDTMSVGALAHIIPLTSTINGNTMTMVFTVLTMDIVDFNQGSVKDETVPFYGNNNLHDVYNTMLQVHNRLFERLRRGDAYELKYEVQGTLSVEPFQDRFANLWAGWAADYTILVPNVDICVE